MLIDFGIYFAGPIPYKWQWKGFRRDTYLKDTFPFIKAQSRQALIDLCVASKTAEPPKNVFYQWKGLPPEEIERWLQSEDLFARQIIQKFPDVLEQWRAMVKQAEEKVQPTLTAAEKVDDADTKGRADAARELTWRWGYLADLQNEGGKRPREGEYDENFSIAEK